MSSILWDGNNLIQKVGDNIEELGHVKFDEHSKDYVLWLRDTRGVLGSNKGYIRGDSFPSMEDAKQHAASSVSARIFHHMWMVGLRDGGIDTGKDFAQDIKDAESGKHPDTLQVIAELQKMQKQLKEAKKGAIRNYVVTLVSLVVAIASLAVAFKC